MGDPVITNNQKSSLVINDPTYVDEIFTGGADTLLANTILARDTGTLLLVLFVKGGSTTGNGIPCCILPTATVIGATDQNVRVLQSGVVREDQLVIDADGDSSNVDGAVRDQLRQLAIIVKPVQELNILDNQ
jgi:hypothetical protein